VINCSICSTEIKRMNRLTFGSGKLSDGGEVCTTCWIEISDLNPTITIDELAGFTTENAIDLFSGKKDSKQIIIENARKSAKKTKEKEEVETRSQDDESDNQEKTEEIVGTEQTTNTGSDEKNRLSKIKDKFNSSNIIEKLVLINWVILFAGVATVASISGGFGIYALLLMILGGLTTCICPCIGIGIAGGAVALWTTLVMINIYTGIFALGIVAIISPIGLGLSLIQKNKIDNSLIYVFIFIGQLGISWAGLYFLFPLIEVWQ